MTLTPSASLHVQTPKLADIKPSNILPPSPLTPQSNITDMSSRAELKLAAEDSTDGHRPPSATSPSPEIQVIDISAPDGLKGDTGHEDAVHDQVVTDQKEDTSSAGPSTTGLLGLQCAPPTILPPSPPLTVADTRDAPEAEVVTSAAASSSAQPANVTAGPPNMREEDITDWRASMVGGERGGEEDGDGDGEYDPYDLGYSPVTPVGPSANTGVLGGETQSRSLALRQITDHPLRFDVLPPSPPPWEVISPPGTVENVRPSQPEGTLRGYNTPKPMSGRPQIPHSAYYIGPPPINSAYGTDPIGQIGVHHPREILRVERDYSGGELIQFSSTYPLELEGRITPTQYLETINTINECLISAHSLGWSCVDNTLAFLSLQLSRLVFKSHYEREMRRLQTIIDEINSTLYNPAGLNILWPRKVAFMFLEIEYY